MAGLKLGSFAVEQFGEALAVDLGHTVTSL
jgi:hypothetical protein